MAKKCPPGIICIENYTFMFLFALIIITLLFLYVNYNNNLNNNLNNNSNKNLSTSYSKYYVNDLVHHLKMDNNNSNYNISNCNKDKNDVLLNPYSAPLRDDRIFNNNNYNGPKIPINVKTQSFDTNYRQIGILTRVNGGETILPLMGRPLFSNRDKWNFYTMNDKNNMIKLPITFKNRSCSSSQGCDNLYNGDTVYVEGYSDIFRVTIYDNNVMEYIPYL
jgi:hypothetical protein